MVNVEKDKEKVQKHIEIIKGIITDKQVCFKLENTFRAHANYTSCWDEETVKKVATLCNEQQSTEPYRKTINRFITLKPLFSAEQKRTSAYYNENIRAPINSGDEKYNW